jgi:hypothetical protein
MSFWKKISSKIVFCAISLVAFSCSYTPEDVNLSFEKKYGAEVGRIKQQREAPMQGAANEMMMSSAPSIADLYNPDSSQSGGEYYAYVDVAKFGEKIPQTYLPNGEVYEQAKSQSPSNSLPANMFEVRYETALYPPFRKIGAEFDRIEIPPADVYGVKTEMSEKSYLLAGNSSMQKNIDQIIAEKTDDEIEISETLIREQKLLKRKQKMIKIFGQDSFESTSLDDEDAIDKNVDEKFLEKKLKKPKNKLSQKKPTTNQRSASNQNIGQANQGFVTTALKK